MSAQIFVLLLQTQPFSGSYFEQQINCNVNNKVLQKLLRAIQPIHSVLPYSAKQSFTPYALQAMSAIEEIPEKLGESFTYPPNSAAALQSTALQILRPRLYI